MDIGPLILNLIYQLFANSAFLFLAALGLIIILGMMNIINLAHGEFMMIGAYVATITYHAGIPFIISIILSFIVVAIFGGIFELLIIRRFYGRELGALVVTWGISLVLGQGTLLVFGPFMPSIKMNLMLGVVYQNRLNPAIQFLKNELNKGVFGKIITASIRLRWARYQDYYEDEWHGTWKQDGGVINQQAIHHVDVMNWLCGPVTEVCATGGNLINNLEAEDTMVGIIKFKNGSFGTIEATTGLRPKDQEASISIVGDKAIATVGGIALNKIEKWYS